MPGSVRLLVGGYYGDLQVFYLISCKEHDMLDFEEELKKFSPSTEIDEAEDAIYHRDMTDMMDVLQEMIRETKRGRD